MDEARSALHDRVYTADLFAALPSDTRTRLRDSLVCTGCGNDAYFIRAARNGRRACFGARPHGDDCELASLATEGGGSSALDETDALINAGDLFRIDSNRPRRVRHVDDDPSGLAPHTGSAMRYSGRGRGGRRTSAMSLDRLLRQLVLRPKFRRTKKTAILLSNDTRHTVRNGCVHMSEIEDKHVRNVRVYWGVIRFPRPREDGGAWLNTGHRGTPTLGIGPDELAALLTQKNMADLEELSGAYFAYMGRLMPSAKGRYLFVNDLDWLALRPHDEDEQVN